MASLTPEQRAKYAVKNRERTRLWRLANRERALEAQRRHYQNNKEIYKARARAYVEKNGNGYVPRPVGHARELARSEGLRSGFERTLSHDLKADGVKFTYETLTLPYVIEANYTPDFILDNGVIIEAKGLLDPESKRKMVAIKRQYPHLDIRMVFMNADQKVPRTKQTHGQWATRNGFIWANRRIPKEWYA